MNIDQLAEEYQAVINGFGFELISADELYIKMHKKREKMMITARPRIDHERLKIEALLEYLRSFMVRWDMAEG